MFRRFSSTFALRPTIRQLLASGPTSQQGPVEIHGWVKSVRRQKKVSFAVITDGSSSWGLQAVFTDAALAKSITNGASVRLNGQLIDSPGAGQDKELRVEAIEILGDCDPETYPIQKQSLSAEYLRDNSHLRARTDPAAAVIRLRDSVMRSLHNCYEAQGFCYVHTPILTSNDCEGGGEAFRIAPVPTDPPSEFFSQPSYLTVSSQLHLEAVASSISRVYTLGPSFRAERSQTNRHLAEFWMFEAEWAFTKDVYELCNVAEASIKQVLRSCTQEDNVLWKKDILWSPADEKRLQSLQAAKGDKSWARMTYTDAVSHLEKHYLENPSAFEYPPGWGRALQSEHERWLAESFVKGPVFVTDYPSSLKPFYMRANDDGSNTVACFDLLVPYVGELVGGSIREERVDVLESSLRKHSLSVEDYGWYLELRRFGGAPHGGFGMGFERLIGWMGGVDNVRECIAMPRWAGRMLL